MVVICVVRNDWNVNEKIGIQKKRNGLLRITCHAGNGSAFIQQTAG